MKGREGGWGRSVRWRVLVIAALTAFCGALSVVVFAAPASAHPLGNISINQAHQLTFRQDRVDDVALLDEAEIPTLQAKPARDRDDDGVLSAAELAAYADAACPRIADGLKLRVASRLVTWTVTGARAEQLAGAAGLFTTRTECALTARVDLSHRTDVSVDNKNHEGRVGWREFTVRGDGIAFDRSDVPRTSPSDGLRSYPADLLSNPLDMRGIDLTTQPGDDSSVPPAPRHAPGPVDRAYAAVQARFDRLVGADEVTVTAGVLATLLAVLLGASHAALPGHGKTIMAVHLATRGADGRRQGVRDAVTVGATVTATHTAGVLATGALLTASTSVTGESVMRWLGLASGLLVVAVGGSLLRGAVAARRAKPAAADAKQPEHAYAGTGHTPHNHRHPHTHGPAGHHHPHPPTDRRALIGMGVVGGLVPSPSALVVLLGTIALGHTLFGVLLVLAYGVGMAAVLTAAGLLLVRFRPRITVRPHRVFAYAPILTAAFIILVGTVLAYRAVR